MIDTEDLTSYYPGYDEYCEPRENQGDEEDFDIDAIIDERRLQEMEEKESKLTKEIVLFNVVYKQGEKDGIFDLCTYHNEFLERIFANEEMQKLPVGMQSTVVNAFQDVMEEIKEEYPYADLSAILSTDE